MNLGISRQRAMWGGDKNKAVFLESYSPALAGDLFPKRGGFRHSLRL